MSENNTCVKRKLQTRLQHRQRGRNQFGSEIVEGVVGIGLILAILIMSLFLILDTFVVILYKIKLAIVTTQVAAYASSLIYPSDAAWGSALTKNAPDMANENNPFTRKTIAYANTLLTNAGLTANNGSPPKIKVSYAPLSTATETVNVQIQLGSLSLLNSGQLLPSWISLQDSATGVARYLRSRDFLMAVVNGPLLYNIDIPTYGYPASSTIANPLNGMKLRPFNQAPQIVTMGIPSNNSGHASPGTGYFYSNLYPLSGPFVWYVNKYPQPGMF